MSPITVSSTAEEVFRKRKSKVQSWYFDLTTAMNYWGKDRLYHHTPPISLIFALREAMRLVVEEGLETRWERHRVNQLALIAGLQAMGLKLLVEKPSDRLPTVTAVMIPGGVDDGKLRNQLLDEFNIEIAGGFGPIKGKIWRIGLRSEEHTSELQSRLHLVCRLLLEKKKVTTTYMPPQDRAPLQGKHQGPPRLQATSAQPAASLRLP